MTISEKQQWAIGRVQYWWNRLTTIYNKNLGSPPAVRFNNADKTAGRAYSSINLIKLSNYFLLNEVDYDETIAHEVAHIYIDRYYGYRCNHGLEWQNAMRRLGSRVTRCHSYQSARPTQHRKSSLLIQCGCGKQVLIGAKNQRKLFTGQTLYTTCCKQKITCERLREKL